ncbi:hypothetical protein AN220_28790, partial [Streptomyces nanshensis]
LVVAPVVAPIALRRAALPASEPPTRTVAAFATGAAGALAAVAAARAGLPRPTVGSIAIV